MGNKTLISDKARSEQKEPNWLARFIPLFQWVPHYERSWLRFDLLAGSTVAALVIPKALGYAGIANVPIQYGLYAAAAGTILYALFGTSKQISTGPSSALAAVAGSAVLVTGLSDNAEIVTLVAGITFVTGILFLLLKLFNMGWMSQFLSKAVITGFLFGAAIEVVVGELPKITGTSAEGSNAWQEMFSWIRGLAEFNRATLLVGLISLVVIFGIRRVAPKIPGALVLVVGGLIASAVFNLGDHGVALVGDVPRGLPPLVFPDLQYILQNSPVIVTAAAGLLLIGFSQSAGDARAFASKHQYRVDINQEALAQGVANVGSGFVQGIPVSTSLSASSLNDTSGAKTPISSLATGGIIILTMLFLAPLFSELPKAVLGALIIEAVVMGMMDVAEMQRLRRVARADFWIAIAAILGVLSMGVLAGVAIGVFLSIIWLIYVSARPHVYELGRKPGTQVFSGIKDHPDYETYPGLLVLRFDAGLFFASADALIEHMIDHHDNADTKLHTVVLDFEGVNFIDSQGAATLSELAHWADEREIELRLTRVKTRVREVLHKDGIIEQIGERHLYGNVYEAAADKIPEAMNKNTSSDAHVGN